MSFSLGAGERTKVGTFVHFCMGSPTLQCLLPALGPLPTEGAGKRSAGGSATHLSPAEGGPLPLKRGEPGLSPGLGGGGGGTHRCDNLDPWPGGLTHSRYTRTGAPQHPSSAILRDRLLPGPPTPARGEGMSQRHRLEMSQPHDQFSEKFYLLPTA